MKLKSLSRCEFECLICIFIGQFIQREPLGWRGDSGRNANADKETVQRFQFLMFAFVVKITVLLLVSAVKFDKHLVQFLQCTCERIVQAFGDGSTQIFAVFLDDFNRTWGRLSLIHISEPTRQAEISYAV